MAAYRGVVPVETLACWKFGSYTAFWMARGTHVDKSHNVVALVTGDELNLATFEKA